MSRRQKIKNCELSGMETVKIQAIKEKGLYVRWLLKQALKTLKPFFFFKFQGVILKKIYTLGVKT